MLGAIIGDVVGSRWELFPFKAWHRFRGKCGGSTNRCGIIPQRDMRHVEINYYLYTLYP